MIRLTFNRNNIFDPIFNDSLIPGVPAVNIIETATHYHIELETLGFKKKDFIIHLDRKILNISVEKRSEEIGNVQFFALPDSADNNTIKTKYTNGVLKFNVAKIKRQNSNKKA